MTLPTTHLAAALALSLLTATHTTSPAPGPVPPPELTAACQMDLCTAELRYHGAAVAVTFAWTTTPAPGYPDNGADALERTVPSTAGRLGGRSTATDFLWHSDIRCDRTVTVTATGPGLPATTQHVDKDVPANPTDAYCSAYGTDR